MKKFLTKILEKLANKLKEKDSQPVFLEEKTTLLEEEKKEEGIEAPPAVNKNPKKITQKEKNEIVSLSEEMGLSPQKRKLISIGGDILLDPDKTESAFIARQLVQATLPHKNPGNIPAWSRKNGNLTLTLRPGYDHKKEKMRGYPYGTLPRLLLFWITTEAIRTKNPQIELGSSLNHFMTKLGMDTSRGGKRSDAKRLKEQMIRLFRSTISFDQSKNGRDSWIDMQVAPKGMLCWDERFSENEVLWENSIQLGEDFFKAIIASPVPVDMRALKALKKSPLALDLYAWATYTAYQTQRTGQPRSLSWELLHEQFGSEYKKTDEFARKAWNALRKVQTVYPELSIERVHGGIQIFPSKPSITIKQKRKKLLPTE